MLREKLKPGLLKVLLLLGAFLAIIPDASAWSHFYLRGSGDDYEGGKRVSLNWNSAENQYEGKVSLSGKWIAKFTVSDNENSDTDWYGPESASTVKGDCNFGLQKDGSDVTFEKGTYNIYLKINNGNPGHVYITKEVEGPITVAGDVYIYGDFSAVGLKKDWDANIAQLTTTDGNDYIYEFTPKENGNAYFKFKIGDVVYSAESEGDVIVPTAHASATSPVVVKGNNGAFKIAVTGGITYEIHLFKSFMDRGRVSINRKGTTDTGKTYYLAGGFLSNWTKRIKFEKADEANDKVLVAVATYSNGNTGNRGFKVTTKEIEDDGVWYSVSSAKEAKVLEKGREYDIAGRSGERANMLLDKAQNLEVTFTITLDDNYMIKTIRTDWEGEAVAPGDQMPVYPIGVYNETGLSNYDKWPVLYLNGKVLNYNRITPEYQFTQCADDPNRYELEFTMRNTKMKDKEALEAYENEWTKICVTGFKDCNSDQTVYVEAQSFTLPKSQEKDGARYKAICEKGTDGKWTLKFEPVGDVEDMPFLSMAGYEWKQRATKATPHNDYDGSLTTDKGWQEAWVQYDSRGNVALDRKNRVMYNTMWPPRNPILFKTEFKVTENSDPKDFTLSSKDLTFKKDEKKSGKEWKKDSRFVKYTTGNLEYTSDEDKPAEFDAPREYKGVLALDDNVEYTLYRVENMWISGQVKLWSGWNGGFDDEDHAVWCNHSNWGHVDGAKEDSFGKTTAINPESTEPLYNVNGDMLFSKPTFFKYVDFFYDNSNPQTVGHSVLFTELAKGGAQIAALSTSKEPSGTNNYQVGNYQPALAHIDDVKNGHVLKVTITVWETNGEGEEMVGEVFNWTGSKATTAFHEIFNNQPGNEQLPGEGGLKDSASTGKWVLDKTDYVNGDYFYRMNVVLTEDAADNVKHDITVDSNPFTIFNTQEKLTLNVYQLVKTGETPTADPNIVTGEYVTFRGSDDDPDTPYLNPTFPVYKLIIENDKKYDGNPTYEYDEHGNLISAYVDDKDFKFTYETLDTIPNYSAPNIQFTDKILIVGSVPSADTVDGYWFNADIADKEDTEDPDRPVTPTNPGEEETDTFHFGPAKLQGADTEEWDRARIQPEHGNRFMHVTNVGNFKERQFELAMKYETAFLHENGEIEYIEGKTDTVATNYYAVVPEPELVNAHIEVHYGNPTNDETANEVKAFSYRGKPFYARFHTVRDYVDINFPNVSRFLQDRMQIRNIFSIVMTDDDTDHEGGMTWNDVFDLSEDTTQNLGYSTYYGDFMHPQRFSGRRKITLERKDGYKFFERWKDHNITSLEVSDNAPVGLASEFTNATVTWENNGGIYGHAYSTITLLLKHEDGFKVEDISEDDHNHISHVGKPELGTHHLMHHGPNDYYYWCVIDASKRTDDTEDDWDAVIDATGELAQNDSTKLHGVVSAEQLIKGAPVQITLRKDLGNMTYEEWMSINDKQHGDNHFTKNLRVLVSYLYPFYTLDYKVPEGIEDLEMPESVITRSVKDYNTDVLKSSAAEIAYTVPEDRLQTLVVGVSAEEGNVETGRGYIEVRGSSVEVCNSNGVVVGEGEGRHYVAPGVYIVRYSGQTQKVLVK